MLTRQRACRADFDAALPPPPIFAAPRCAMRRCAALFARFRATRAMRVRHAALPLRFSADAMLRSALPISRD